MGSLKKNMFFQTAYQILSIALSLITTPLVTRTLGADSLGQYSYTAAIVAYFSLFALLGVNNYGTREIAFARSGNDKKQLSKTFWGIYGLQIILSLCVIAVYYLYIVIWVEKYKILAIIQGIYLLGTLTDVSWFYFGTEQFKVTVTRSFITKISCLLIIVFFIKSPKDIYLYTITMIGSTLFSNLFLLAGLRKQICRVKLTLSDMLKHLKANLILFIPVIASSMYTFMDKIMLGSISGTINNGYYDAMERLISAPYACISAITSVIYPRISALVKQDKKEQINWYLQLSFMGICGFSVACFFGAAGVAYLFVPMFLGAEFAPTANLLVFGCLILLPRGLRTLIKSGCLLPNKKDKEVIITIVAGSVCNLIVNILLIPRYGAMGAVVATILAELVTCIWSFFYARKEIHFGRLLLINLPFWAFGAAMLFLIRWMDTLLTYSVVIKLLLLVIAGALFYMILSGIYMLLLQKRKKRE